MFTSDHFILFSKFEFWWLACIFKAGRCLIYSEGGMSLEKLNVAGAGMGIIQKLLK